MPVDLSQFHQTFFEESFEGLGVMESGLLALIPGNADPESINTLFRVAHSIKGGSSMFGFTAITEFTHVMETLLDKVRSEECPVTQGSVDLLLRSVDFLRNMLAAVRDNTDHDAERGGRLREQLEEMIENGNRVTASPIPRKTEAADAGDVARGWRVMFRPHRHLLTTGNDPLPMLRELSLLGDLDVSIDVSKLPRFQDLDPEACFLGWDLMLHGAIPRAQIAEIFEWVESDCDLEITPIARNTLQANTRPTGKVVPIQSADSNSEVNRLTTSAVGPAPSADEGNTVVERRKNPSAGHASSIRVNIEKIDALINIVGELVITQSTLSQIGEDFAASKIDKLRDGLIRLARNTRELQESVLRIRMLPISFSFNRFPRLVRDLSQQLCKKIDLTVSGEQTEIDKTVLEKLSDPLVHLVRNSLDHGIELPEVRKARRKDETGHLHLHAYHEGGNIVIEVADDGAGLNKAKILQRAREHGIIGAHEALAEDKIHELIFQPGFSTADMITDISGRGVGMDVVRRNIKDLGGSIEIKSEEGLGSTFTIRLPLTLAILDGQLVRIGRHIYIIPLVSIVESLQVAPKCVSRITGKGEIYKLRTEYLPIIRLYEVFNVVPDSLQIESGILVVVEGDGQRAGIYIDELLGQQQVVLKSVETNYTRVQGISGATILGDSTVALILDVPGVVELSRSRVPVGFRTDPREAVLSAA
ncbi:MAG: chemotaxis protein CheA [Pseudomonadota bacterium]|nr:chemotaxis protein CheA [Pseudomonadota bacterium]